MRFKALSKPNHSRIPWFSGSQRQQDGAFCFVRDTLNDPAQCHGLQSHIRTKLAKIPGDSGQDLGRDRCLPGWAVSGAEGSNSPHLLEQGQHWDQEGVSFAPCSCSGPFPIHLSDSRAVSALGAINTSLRAGSKCFYFHFLCGGSRGRFNNNPPCVAWPWCERADSAAHKNNLLKIRPKKS